MSSLFMRKRRPVGGYTNALAYDCINAIRHRAGLSSLSGLSGSGLLTLSYRRELGSLPLKGFAGFDLVSWRRSEANSNKDPTDLQPIVR